MIDFPVQITRQLNAISERGFGTILILDHEADRNYQVLTKEEISILKEGSSETKAYKIASRLFMQNPEPEEVAVFGKNSSDPDVLVEALEELIDKNNDWFFIVSTDNAETTIKKLAAFAEVQDKMYATTIHDVDQEEGVLSSVLDDLKYDNTFVLYHDDVESYLAEGLAVIMSQDVGAKTAKFKEVKGVKEAKVSASLLAYLHQAGSFTYIEKLGNLQTTEGFVTSGEYIDTILGEYWIRFRMEEAAQRVAMTNDKIPYTNTGIGLLVGAAEEQLSLAVELGILEDYEVTYKRREDVPSNDAALRKYDYVAWVGQMAGAIHQGTIKGILTYDTIVREE